MKYIQICIVFLTCLLSTAAFSADGSGKYAIRGAGLIDCETFLAEQQKRSPEYLMMGGWIDGYITGINQYAANTYDSTSFESTELFVEIVKNHCTKKPKDRLLPVINSIIKQRWESRIKTQSKLVGIRLGDKGTQLYTETILRIQKRLAEKGLYKSPMTGKFDTNTITALAAFQKSLKGYEATGFPDQATLWALLVE